MNLFVYGTLMSEHTQKIVSGKTFKYKKAVLHNFKKVASPECYPFITPHKGVNVEGYVLYSIDPVSLKRMDKYEAEGDLYWRKTVYARVEGEINLVECDVYIGNIKSIKKYFKPGTDLYDRIEEYVETEIDDIILSYHLKQTDLFHTIAQSRIIKELLGSTIDAILNTRMSHVCLPVSFLAKNLESAGLPTLSGIKNNTEILPYADNYIKLAVRHIILNQIEAKIYQEFKGEVKVSDEFFPYGVSIMIALEFMNAKETEVKTLMARYLADTFHDHWKYVDYADVAIKVADFIYDKDIIENQIDHYKRHSNPGIFPLGAEVEFSTMGRFAVQKERPPDPEYNYFRYFNDFDLRRRLWKLGGHIDDHRFPDPYSNRSYGFLEYAFGKLDIYDDLSKPVTNDPYLLNRLINEATIFTGVRPHSLHISIEAREPVRFDRKNKIEHLICMLYLGADLGFDHQNKLKEKRISNEEILDHSGLLRFSSENIHYQDADKQNKKTVVEYQFPRLYKDFDYEPLIMALKGYQISVNPRPLCPAENLDNIAFEEMALLRQWANSPTPIPDDDITGFLDIAQEGLLKEKSGSPAHTLTYIRKNITMAGARIKAKNKFVALNSNS